MYQALYRKWRPQTFDEVIGQKHITETLKNQVKTGRLSHAYIFIGTRGTGKTTCARILARAVNCENPVNGNPCGKCAACRGIIDGSVMDVVELDAASNNGVDNVRALREEAVFSPADVKKRVYIIDEVHMLSASAFNALLKILEEPPEHLMFILATTELHKVPATILSRCQRHIFHRIDTPVIGEYLMDIAGREGFKITHQAAELIARMADGGVRDALSLLDQCSASENIDADAVYSAMGLAGNRRISQMLSLILKHDTPVALKEFSGMWMDGKDPATLLGELSSLLRDILMLQVAPKGGLELISGGYDSETLKGFTELMTREELICALDTIQIAMAGLRDVKNPKTVVELCIISLCDNSLGDSISALKARVSRLERQISQGITVSKAQPDEAQKAEINSAHTEEYPRYEERAPIEEPPFEPEYVYESAPPDERADLPEPVPVMEKSEYNSPERDWDTDDSTDDMYFSVFQEEQPEDALLQHRGSDTMSEEEERSLTGPSDTEIWPLVCEKVTGLPMDIKTSLPDNRKVRGRVQGDTLYIDVIPGFTYERFKKQEIQTKFQKKASEIGGREIRVKLGELREEQRSARSIDEIKKYKEVRFI